MRDWLSVEASPDANRSMLEVQPGLCTGGSFLFGGCGLAAAIVALEGHAGRPTIWATGQYLSFARPPERLDIDTEILVEGHQMTQARATCHVGDRAILHVSAALGERPFDGAGQWDTMPDVPAPEACPPRPMRFDSTGTIASRLEQRVARYRGFDDLDGTPGDGHTTVWMRLIDPPDEPGAAMLAIMGDFVPLGVGQALGGRIGGNSLDNTLRVVAMPRSEWVLVNIHINAVQRGFGHGIATMYDAQGSVVAIASQSCIARHWEAIGPGARVGF